MRRRDTLSLGAAALWPAGVLAQPADADASGAKVLRVAFPVAETGFDPARIVDLYSRTVTPHIFEALYTYDHLARPIRFRPLTSAAMPGHTDDFREWTVRLRPGIHFADDPAFGARRRELVAEDDVYSFKRIVDPANRSLNAGSAFMFFNMDDPVVGGYTPDKVALRRAIALAIDTDRLIREANRIAVAYMPYKFTVHRIANEPVQPWLVGYRRPLFWRDGWQWVDIDPALGAAR